jgi:hypothetical protein
MPNLLDGGATWLGEQLEAAAGRLVTYSRRQVCAQVTGWPAAHEYEVLNEDGIPLRVLSIDWTFRSSGLLLDGQRVEPRTGDVIEECIDGEEFRYEAMPLGKKPCFEWLDTSGRLLLVHTKRIS